MWNKPPTGQKLLVKTVFVGDFFAYQLQKQTLSVLQYIICRCGSCFVNVM
jgi:hypothetical protein